VTVAAAEWSLRGVPQRQVQLRTFLSEFVLVLFFFELSTFRSYLRSKSTASDDVVVLCCAQIV
jgi:hypothetical protein